ncbi:hypothetical protein NFC81_00930 [Salinispirillum sp. LH 10-3-1]|uniref:Transglutaminase-like domain-containing protein n=1 Tax=Salinispirillum sp. LH 10-3-1 TaxID=2952525 RepID=A0AB38YGE8_9GAMM
MNDAMLSQMNVNILSKTWQWLAVLGFTVGLCSLSSGVQAQANQEFRQWLAEQQSRFSAFRDQHDADFARWLDEQWVSFDTFVQQPPAAEPKPEAAPTWVEPELTPQPPVITTPEPPAIVAPTPAPVTPTPAAPPSGQRMTLRYEGLSAELRVNQPLQGRLPTRVDERAIADYWQVMSAWRGAEEVGRLVAELARRNHLNTYDQLLVMHSFAGQIVERAEAQTLLTWYLAVRQGMQVRVGYDNDSVYLLVATRQSQYNVPYVTYQGVRFYAFSPQGQYPLGQITSYSEQHRRASSFVELLPHPALNVGGTWTLKPVTVDMFGTDEQFQLPVNDALVSHLERYPQLSLQDYFAQPMPLPMRDVLREQLQPRLRGMSLFEQASYLLRFAQFVTGYKTDQEQFGQENYQHPIESFANGYNDCEDRALIYALLVRDLLRVDVVALYFPGHVATAIQLPPRSGLGSTQVGGATFYWADPSYLHAPLGRLIPQVEGRAPQIIGVP